MAPSAQVTAKDVSRPASLEFRIKGRRKSAFMPGRQAQWLSINL